MPDIYAERILQFVTKQITASHHVEFYLNWSTTLLTIHAAKDNVFKQQTLLAIQDSFTRKYEALNKICDFNKYTLKVLSEMARAKDAEVNMNGDDNKDEDDAEDSYFYENNLVLIRPQSDLDEEMASDTSDSL